MVLDPSTRRIDEATLFGGSPARVLRLSHAGRRALAELLDGPVATQDAGRLGRRLTDAGIAIAQPPAEPPVVAVTVVIPVRDRAPELDRCLAAMGGEFPVVVVDDGSSDAPAVARVAAAHGARLVRRATNGGPAAARNSALALVETEIIAMLDSDCVPAPGWIEALLRHFADPLVAVAAPRISPRLSKTAVERYSAARSSLDLGARPAAVAPGSRVAYVPTAALLTRRSALLQVASENRCAGQIFDESLRHGEDVDLIWRLRAAGWRIRYDPSVRVEHDEPATWSGVLGRRFRYGTSAAPLAMRHPTASVALVLPAWPAVAIAGLACGYPELGAVGVAGTVRGLRRAIQRAGLPKTRIARGSLQLLWQVWLGTGRYASQFLLPGVVFALIAGRPGRRRRIRRAVWAALVLAPVGSSWRARRPVLDPVRTGLASLADDAAYGAGVWAGCLRHHTLRPLRPRCSSYF